MSRLFSKVTGWALAATGGVLAIAAVASVVLLSGGRPTGTAQARPVAGHAPAATARAASASTMISARKTSIGTILVGPGGRTLYAFSKDSKNKDVCASISGCLSVWPIVSVHGKLTAGSGVKRSLLSTITVHGHKQATYAGHPLYTYVSDDGPGDTDYVGIVQSGGAWPAVAPSGKLVK